MELWIRSQDRKKIMKVDEVKIETVKDGNTFIYSHATDLGTYETKERALEVLDEIHQRLINLQCVELTRANYISNQMKRNGIDCVYEMPLE